MIRVARLSISPVKSLGLGHPRSVRLERFGVAEDRRFLLLTEEGRPVDARRLGCLLAVRSEYDDRRGGLALRFPDGRVVDGVVDVDGAAFETDLWGRRVSVRAVAGRWSEAMTSYAGTPLTLVRTERPGDGVDVHPVSLVSRASIEELSRRAGRAETVASGRFRMLLEVEGCRPHEEDEWLGGDVRVGGTTVRVVEHDARCAITTMDPDTGEVDFPTLKVIAAYRRRGRRLPFGVYAEVVEPGPIAVGDPVAPLGA
jgi:uncharacterized protein YcbX